MIRRTSQLLFLCVVLLSLLWGCASDESEPEPKDGWTTAEPEADMASADVAPDTAVEEVLEISLGDPCASDSDCGDGVCLSGPSWPGGYCSSPTCETCPDDGACLTTGECALECRNDDHCREGYGCIAEAAGGGRVCVIPAGVADGEACEANADCQGGRCLTDFPDGYCTTWDCSTFADCSRLGFENRCLLSPSGINFCARICTQNSDCRIGYICEQINRTQGYCSPDPREPIDRTLLDNHPLPIQCLADGPGDYLLDFEVAADTRSYMITPFNLDHRDLTPTAISLPSGNDIDLQGTNAFQSIPSTIYGGMNPTVVPATLEFYGQLESGSHQYSLTSTGAELCWYVLEESTPGTTIDLNVYLVGFEDLSAADAENDPDFQAVFSGFDVVFQSAGFELGKLRYIDLDDVDSQRFAFLRDRLSFPSLVSRSKMPGSTLDEVLSVNIFFVQGIAGSILGISLGLPGPAGLHSTQGSGVIFTSEYMGRQTRDGFGNEVDGNTFTAQVLAHEIGHYLGLFHTTEQDGVTHDPLSDTPECTDLNQNCPDFDNLMFPFAAAANQVITRHQSFVLSVNPLTKDPVDDPASDPSNGGSP